MVASHWWVRRCNTVATHHANWLKVINSDLKFLSVASLSDIWHWTSKRWWTRVFRWLIYTFTAKFQLVVTKNRLTRILVLPLFSEWNFVLNIQPTHILIWYFLWCVHVKYWIKHSIFKITEFSFYLYQNLGTSLQQQVEIMFIVKIEGSIPCSLVIIFEMSAFQSCLLSAPCFPKHLRLRCIK
jgi:hypothetical protein